MVERRREREGRVAAEGEVCVGRTGRERRVTRDGGLFRRVSGEVGKIEIWKNLDGDELLESRV